MIRLGIVLGSIGVAALAVLALFGFAVPELDLLNHGQLLLFPALVIALLIASLALRNKARVATMMVLFMGLAASASVVVPEFGRGLLIRPGADGGGTIRMMTHNLFGMNYDMEQVTAAIFAEDPDIVVLQEYFGEQATDLHPRLIGTYPYFVRCRGGKRANLGLYSRLPFERIEDGRCPDNAYVTDRTGHILARFETAEGKPFSVITTHMDWPFPMQRQQEQFNALSEVVNQLEGPVILAGDFNSTPWSYMLRAFMADSGMVRQTINLATYPTRWYYLRAWRDAIPFLPLDHVMTKDGIVVHDLQAGRPTASDHLPVVFDFSVP